MSTQSSQSIITADSVTGLAKHFVSSGWFKDTTDLSKAVVKIMAGQELGIGPMASMSGIQIIQGKPVLSANLLAAQIKNSNKYNYKVLKRDNEECQIEFYERFSSDKLESVGVSHFSIVEAKQAGLTIKDVWKSYASDMLFARAISRGSRTYCPDIFNGAPVYTPGELEESPPSPSVVSTEGVQMPNEAQMKRYFDLIKSYAEHYTTPEKPVKAGDIDTMLLAKLGITSHNQITLKMYDLVCAKLEISEPPTPTLVETEEYIGDDENNVA
jgi:hypothetical protein